MTIEEESFNSLKELVKDQTYLINKLNSRIIDSEDNMASLQLAIEDLQSKINRPNTELTDIKSDIKKLFSELEMVSEHEGAYADDIEELQSDISSLKEKLCYVANIDDLEAKVRSITDFAHNSVQRIDSEFKESKEELESSITFLSEDVAKDVGALQNKVASQANLISELQNKVASQANFISEFSKRISETEKELSSASKASADISLTLTKDSLQRENALLRDIIDMKDDIIEMLKRR